MKIAILLFDGITALDAVGPYESLSGLPQSKILFVAKQPGPVRTGNDMLGFVADTSMADIQAADVLILPGASDPGLTQTARDPFIQAWIRKIDGTTRRTCSVCTGSLILGAAGLLVGRNASTHWRAKDALANFGALYSASRVTIDGKYMTSAGVSAGIDLGLMLCAELAGAAIAEAVELSMEYDPQPPFGTGNAAHSATPERRRLIETALK